MDKVFLAVCITAIVIIGIAVNKSAVEQMQQIEALEEKNTLLEQRILAWEQVWSNHIAKEYAGQTTGNPDKLVDTLDSFFTGAK